MEISWKKLKISEISSEKLSLKHYDEITYLKLKNNIKKNGQLKNLVVAQIENKYYLLDGHYIYNIMQELELETVYCCVVKDIKDEDALLISLELNATFRNDIIKIAKRIKDLLNSYSASDISISTDFYEKEIQDYPNILTYDFKKYDANLHNNLFMESNDEYF